MKIPYKVCGPYLQMFTEGLGGDDLLIRVRKWPVIGADAIISRGSDCGSFMSIYHLTEDQVKEILSDNPPFTKSYTAYRWLEANARQYKDNE